MTIMKLSTIIFSSILFVGCAIKSTAQGNSIVLCDRQSGAASKCLTLSAPATISTNFSATLPGTNAFGSLMQSGSGSWMWNGFGPATVSPNIATGSGVKVFVNSLVDDGSGAIFEVFGITSSQGYISEVTGGSWQGFNSNTDGALLRGYAVGANVANVAGGYVDFAPITYSPTPGYTCYDIYGNAVSYPVPLPGLSSSIWYSGGSGQHNTVMWNSTSPMQGYHVPFTVVGSSNYYSTGVPCAAPLPVEPGEPYGLNTNTYIFASGGFATDNTAWDAIQLFTGGAQAATFVASTLYAPGTQLRSGFTPNSITKDPTGAALSIDGSGKLNNQYGAWLGGYIYSGYSDQNPSVGTISTVDNPILPLFASVTASIFPGMLSYNTSLDCEVVSNNSLAFGCIGGTGLWTLTGSLLYPNSTGDKLLIGRSSDDGTGSPLQVLGNANVTGIIQSAVTGTSGGNPSGLTFQGNSGTFQVDYLGNISGGGISNLVGGYKVNGATIVDTYENASFLTLTINGHFMISSAGAIQSPVTGSSITFQNTNANYQVDGNGNISGAGIFGSNQSFDPKTYSSSSSLTTPTSGYGGLAHKGGSQYWYYNPSVSAWAAVDLASAGGSNNWTLSGSLLYPNSTGDKVLIGRTTDDGTASPLQVLGNVNVSGVIQSTAAGSSLAFQGNSGTFQVDGYGDVSGGGDLHMLGKTLLGLASTDVSYSSGGIVSGDAFISATATTNASTASLKAVGGSYVALASSHTGSGTNLPLTFWTGGSEQARITTGGLMLLGYTSDTIASARLQVNGSIAIPPGQNCYGCGPNTQTVYPSGRVLGTVYQNTGLTSMFVSVSAQANAATFGSTLFCASDSSSSPTTGVGQFSNLSATFNMVGGCTFVVLPSNYYKVYLTSGSGSLSTWTEWK